MNIHLALRSANIKTGPIPVSTTSADTCPTACPLREAGCYAKHSRLGIFWHNLTNAKPGESFKHGRATVRPTPWRDFLKTIAALPAGQLWRHNQAGDLPGKGNRIAAGALRELVRANTGKCGFTYTHKPMTAANAALVKEANAAGFTINLSADNLKEADDLARLDVGPIVVVLPDYANSRQTWLTPNYRKVVVCPATYRDDVTCASCGLCAVRNRAVIVGFPAHGAARKAASAIAES